MHGCVHGRHNGFGISEHLSRQVISKFRKKNWWHGWKKKGVINAVGNMFDLDVQPTTMTSTPQHAKL